MDCSNKEFTAYVEKERIKQINKYAFTMTLTINIYDFMHISSFKKVVNKYSSSNTLCLGQSIIFLRL